MLFRQDFTPPNSTKSYPILQNWITNGDPDNIEYVKLLDSRDYSSTYIIKYKTTELVLKYIYAKAGVKLDSIHREITLHLKAAQAGIAPQIHWAFTFEIGGVILMDKLDIELGKYLIREIKAGNSCLVLMIRILALLERLHDLQIYHGDIAMTNIMLKLHNNDEMPELYLIDFGASDVINDSAKFAKRDFELLVHALTDLYHDFKLIQLQHLSILVANYADTRYR